MSTGGEEGAWPTEEANASVGIVHGGRIGVCVYLMMIFVIGM